MALPFVLEYICAQNCLSNGDRIVVRSIVIFFKFIIYFNHRRACDLDEDVKMGQIFIFLIFRTFLNQECKNWAM